MNIINRISTLCLIASIVSSMFGISGCRFKGHSTIYNPDIEKNETSNILEISKIVFTDTATVFYFDAYHCTNQGCWFSIAERTVLQGSHQTYKIIGCDGIELGKKVQVSESGHLDFILYFEPVNKSEKMVDFKEGDNVGDFHIAGIKLYNVKTPPSTTAIKCTLKGEVIDRPQSSRLMLSKYGQDMRTIQWISIPIRDGKFEYILNCDHEELYTLTFSDEWNQGSWRPMKFISEHGAIHFTLHSEDQYEMNRVEGGKLNKELSDYDIEDTNKVQPLYDALNARQEQLYKEGKYYTPEAQSLLDRMNASTDVAEKEALADQWRKLNSEGLDITPYAKEVQKSGDSVSLVMLHWRLQYVREHPNIVGYSILVSEAMYTASQFKTDISPIVDIYQTIFAPKFPDHSYTAQMIDLLTGSSLKPGLPFVDFTAVDFTGKPVKLSERIAGKPAVLHLWASWCGPCRKKGMELIPVYKEFSDKGFVVLGVAREKDTSVAAETAVKLDKYPWENLVEIDDVEQIWNKYGIGNAGGSDFLIDENGIIVAVAPSIEEIRDFLKNR